MRNFAFIAAFALVAALGLSACSKGQNQSAQATQAAVAKPTNPNDTEAWKKYLVPIVTANMQGVQNSPYIYFVPAGDDQAAQDERGRVQDTINGVVAATVLPGNMIAVAGPDPAKTADVLVAAFKSAQAGSFKGVVVLYVGDSADEQRAKDAVVPSGAEFRFAAL